MALVKAQDAAEVKVLNNSGLYTNRHGYAVVPYVTPYHRTHLTLDTTDLGQNVDLLGDTRTIVPTNGALALADFPTASGQKVMFTLQGANVPFGATASVQNDNRTTEGIVDDQKRVWLTGVPDKGSLQVRWQGGRCTAPYQITASSSSVLNVTAACH